MLEQHIPRGCEQSSRNWGWCRQQNRDARELPLSGLALRLWDELTAEIGRDLGFRRCGLVYATDDPKQLGEWEKWRETARRFGVNTRMLSAAEAAATIPGTGRHWLGGVHSVEDGNAEPGLAAPVIAEGARVHGATILAADLVANDTPCVDPAPFRLSRLLDGSKLEVGAI